MLLTRTGFFKGLFAGAVAPSMAIAPLSRSTQWEHKFIRLSYKKSDAEHQEEFNALGIDGWELVAIQYERAFFKRPKAQSPV